MPKPRFGAKEFARSGPVAAPAWMAVADKVIRVQGGIVAEIERASAKVASL